MTPSSGQPAAQNLFLPQVTCLSGLLPAAFHLAGPRPHPGIACGTAAQGVLLEEKQFQEQVYAAVMKLPEKQAKRIYARYYLGMTVNEIAEVEGVDPSRVRDSIRRGLKQLAKYF